MSRHRKGRVSGKVKVGNRDKVADANGGARKKS